MKNSIILCQTDKSSNDETLKKGSDGKLLKLIIFIFLFSWIALLSSCFVAGPRPGHVGRVVVVEKHSQGVPHDNGVHRGHKKIFKNK